MIVVANTYSFPTLVEMGRLCGNESSAAGAGSDQLAVEQAIADGYQTGLLQGQAAAEAIAKEVTQAARKEGFEQGRNEGLAGLRPVADALSEALSALSQEETNLVRECESFCVDLTLAIVARLIEVDTVRAEFVSRAVAAALKVLAPQPPSAIFMNPTDRAYAQPVLQGLPLQDDETLTTGHTRVEAGRLVVEAGIEDALAQIQSAVLNVKRGRGGVESVIAKSNTESVQTRESVLPNPTTAAVQAKQGGQPEAQTAGKSVRAKRNNESAPNKATGSKSADRRKR